MTATDVGPSLSLQGAGLQVVMVARAQQDGRC